MKKPVKMMRLMLMVLISSVYCILPLIAGNIHNQTKAGSPKQIIIENFDIGSFNLSSYPDEDAEPNGWELNSAITYDNSPWSLRLFGNTWKVLDISPNTIDTGVVWQVSAFVASKAEIQGFAVMDGTNVLFYSFAGTEQVNIEEWEPVYQGCFPLMQWNDYQLPIADDWMARFDYLPVITSIVFINDRDGSSQGEIYFDNIIDISNDLPFIPEVSIDYTIGKTYPDGGGYKLADVQFTSEVFDPDSDTHDYFWNFGDGSTSIEQNPQHTFLVSDDHPYRVLLRVVDSTSRWGQASCSVEIDEGTSTFPVTLNFVGDIMLARRYENPGGIIPTLGVEAIFEPTLSILGGSADITIANLECPLTTYGVHHPTKSIYFKGSPSSIAGLTYAGIDIVSLANNHILDYMQEGMQETQSLLKDNNILYMGAGANSYEAYQPVFYSKSGVNFAFLAASDRTGQYSNQQPYLNAGYNKPGFANLEQYYIKKQLDQVKDVSDLVVMEWHTGYEYALIPSDNGDTNSLFAEDNESDENYFPLAYTPDPKSRSATHFAIDNGADLVICHHPHVLQGVEVYHSKLIAHSLGNFVFDQEYPETYNSVILNSKVNETGFYEFTITPIYIDDYIPRRATGGLGLHILDDLAQRSKYLDTYLDIDRDSITAKIILDTTNLVTSYSNYTASLSMISSGINWTTPPHRLVRSGSISSVDSISPGGNYQFRLGRELIFFGSMEDEGCSLWDLNSNYEAYCDSVVFTGVRSIQQIRTSNSTTNVITNFEERLICPSITSQYSLCGYIRTQNAANVSIEIRYHQDRTGIVILGTENIGQISGDTPWTFYHKELTIPTGTKFFDIRLSSGIPSSGTAYSWFDDVSVIRWDEWDIYAISESIPIPNDYYFIQIRSQDNTGNIILSYTEAIHKQAHDITARLTVFLEGPFNGTEMNTTLYNNPELNTCLPISQPYNMAPWNYYGPETVDSIPNSDIVDWILVEFRDAPDAISATGNTMINRQAAFLLRDGSVSGIDGISPPRFSGYIFQGLFAIVHHRNHIAVMSASPLMKTEGSYTYDFTTSIEHVFGGEAGYKSISPGIYGMAGGDANADGSVDINDKILWETSSGTNGYLPCDFNFDGQIDNLDKNDLWILNNDNLSSQVPE